MPDRRWLSSLALLLTLLPGTTRAQESSDWTQVPLVRTARVGLSGDVLFEPMRSWSLGGLFAPFITERWQVGVAPQHHGYSAPGGATMNVVRVSAFANYHIGSNGRFRPFVGGYAEVAGSSQGAGETWYGAQAGWTYFLSPFTALRGEYRFRIRLGEQRDYWNYSGFVITLDPYVRGRATRSEFVPVSFGALDIAFTGQAQLEPNRRIEIDAMLAPFLLRWLQVGGEVNYFFYAPSASGFPSLSTRSLGAFTRLYAPVATRLVPFVGGATGGHTSSNGSPALTSRKLFGGIRHSLGPRAAMDVSLSWQRYSLITVGTLRFRPPDELALKTQIVTQVRRGR